MKKFLLIAAPAVMALSAPAMRAQTVVVPGGTTHQASFNVANTCPSGVTCTAYNVYRCTGTAATCALNSAVWTLMNATPIPFTTSTYVDGTVVAGTGYVYEVDALATVNGVAEVSPPVQGGAGTVPLGPTAPAVTGFSEQ
jgi:hypothetical protein